jgi:hypothetical protein
MIILFKENNTYIYFSYGFLELQEKLFFSFRLIFF